MKYFFTLLVCTIALIPSRVGAQCTVSITPATSIVCAGDAVTLTANVTPPATGLTTTLAGGNNHRGNIFDITATNTVTITSFDAHPMGNTTIAVYYRTGPYAGFEGNASAWTLIGSAAVTALPMGTPTPVPVPVNVTIPSGQTYAFYVTSTNTAISLNYTDGSSVGAPYTSDANIVFRQGLGLEYPFGGNFSPRVFNGVIHYTTTPTGTPTYLWNTTATTQSINPTVNGTTQYTVQSAYPGCPTMNDTISVQVSIPPVSAGTNQSVCTGASATLAGAGAVSYTWNNGVTNNVSFIPASTMNYIVTGTDTIGCTNTDTVTVTVNPLPTVVAGPDQTVCAGASVVMSGSGALTYTWNNGVINNTPFVPISTMDYIVTGTDVNNCSNKDTVNIAVNTVNTSVTVTDPTIMANAAGAAYMWLDCNNSFAPVAGETAQSFTATANGSYALLITENGCSDTSSCVTISSVSVLDLSSSAIKVYPNPTTGQLYIDALTESEILVTDLSGKMIITVQASSGKTEIDLTNYSNGVYFVTVKTAEKTTTSKINKF